MNHGSALSLVQWPLLVCELTALGVAGFALGVVPPATIESARVRQRALWFIRAAALIGVVWAPLAMLGQVAEMAGVRLRATIALAPQVLSETHVGRLWIVRLALVAALAAAAWLVGSGRNALGSLAALILALLVARGLSSHAVDKGWLDVAVYVIHEAAAGLWFGALFGLCFAMTALGTASLDEAFAASVGRLSTLAGGCVAALVASGTYTAWRELGLSIDRLLYSAYGRTLEVKLAIAALAIAIGGYNRYWLLPRLGQGAARRMARRNALVELMVLSVVLACSVILANTPPAH